MNPGKEKIWKEHLSQAKASGKSDRAFCQEQELSISTFQYWKRKIENPGGEKQGGKSPFVQIEMEKEVNRLPDPGWVAEIIFHLSMDWDPMIGQ